MSTEKLFFDLVRACGKDRIVILPQRFEKTGDSGNYSYYQHLKNNSAFMYEVTNTETQEVHYEVFKSAIMDGERREKYPWELDDVLSTSNKAAAVQMWVSLFE